MGTATDIETMMLEAERQFVPVRNRLDGFARDVFRLTLETKVPCIKYGRRKRKMRRMFPPMPKITISI